MVQHSVRQWRVLGVLAVEALTDHLDVGLLTHLLSGLHPKADVASANTFKGKTIRNMNTSVSHWQFGGFLHKRSSWLKLVNNKCVNSSNVTTVVLFA